MHGFFKRLHADHAGSHRAEVFRSACQTYGIDPDVRPRGPAHYGTHIERLIGTMTRKMRLLPGATGGTVTARDGYDAEAEAAMTLEEFERWLVREICRYHHTQHDGLGRIAPAQMWSTGVGSHGPLVPPGVDVEQLTRRFLPWVERTVQSGGVKIDHIRYWHESLARRLGLKIMIHYDDRTIQAVYPDIDGVLLAAAAVGAYPNVTKPEWDVAVSARRQSGVLYQHAGGQAEIARLVHANRQEVVNAKSRTRRLRDARKREEREGISHAAQPPNREVSNESTWVSAAEVHDDGWLKWRD
jgi:putative transposase